MAGEQLSHLRLAIHHTARASRITRVAFPERRPLRRPGFLYQLRLEILAVKTLPTLIDGLEVHSRSPQKLSFISARKCW